MGNLSKTYVSNRCLYNVEIAIVELLTKLSAHADAASDRKCEFCFQAVVQNSRQSAPGQAFVAMRCRQGRRRMSALDKTGRSVIRSRMSGKSQAQSCRRAASKVNRRQVPTERSGPGNVAFVGEPRNHAAGSVYGFGRHLDGDEFRRKNTGLDNFLKRCTRVKAGIFPVCLLRCARQ